MISRQEKKGISRALLSIEKVRWYKWQIIVLWKIEEKYKKSDRRFVPLHSQERKWDRDLIDSKKHLYAFDLSIIDIFFLLSQQSNEKITIDDLEEFVLKKSLWMHIEEFSS